MKKLIPFVLSLASLALVPATAGAIEINVSRDIQIAIRGRAVDVGQLVFRSPELTDDGADVDELGFDEVEGLEPCTYYVAWTNDASLRSRTSLVMEEIATVGYEDCEENSEQDFATLLFLDQGEDNHGFNRQQQRRAIQQFVLGEGEDGNAWGVIQFEDGALYSVNVDP